MTQSLLQVENLVSGYHEERVIDGVSLSISAGETVALLGRNGVGKSTLLKTIMSMIRAKEGKVRVNNHEYQRRRPNAIARAGVAIVPQGRRVFAPLSVAENLHIVARREGDWSIQDVYHLMPRLHERRKNLGNQLSGGEQQMLAIGRALLCSPRLLLLDEPSDGLAPAVVDEIQEVLTRLVDGGLSVLLVEQNLRLVFELADRVLVMAKGKIIHEGTTTDFRSDKHRAHRLLGVGA